MNKEQAEAKVDKLTAAIKGTWAKITDNDVLLLKSERDKFFAVLKEKHGIAKEEAEKKVKEIEAQCGCNDTKAA